MDQIMMASHSGRWIARTRVGRILRFAVLFVAVHAMTPIAVWAQGDSESSSSGKSYVLNYLLLVACVALGLIVICRMGKRTTQIPSRE